MRMSEANCFLVCWMMLSKWRCCFSFVFFFSFLFFCFLLDLLCVRWHDSCLFVETIILPASHRYDLKIKTNSFLFLSRIIISIITQLHCSRSLEYEYWQKKKEVRTYFKYSQWITSHFAGVLYSIEILGHPYIHTYIIDHYNPLVRINIYGDFFSAKKISPCYKVHKKNYWKALL